MAEGPPHPTAAPLGWPDHTGSPLCELGPGFSGFLVSFFGLWLAESQIPQSTSSPPGNGRSRGPNHRSSGVPSPRGPVLSGPHHDPQGDLAPFVHSAHCTGASMGCAQGAEGLGVLGPETGGYRVRDGGSTREEGRPSSSRDPLSEGEPPAPSPCLGPSFRAKKEKEEFWKWKRCRNTAKGPAGQVGGPARWESHNAQVQKCHLD